MYIWRDRVIPTYNIYKYNNAKRSIPAHPTLFNDAHCDLHPLTMVNMSAKFDEEAHNGSVSIAFTRSKRDGHTHGHAHTRTEPQPNYYIPLRNALRRDNNL